jgi:cellulose biosynthesis protein BcsQ
VSPPVIAFFNNKGGVGKTSLVYHLAWMFAELGRRVLVADLDPQGNLTAAFLAEDELAEVWPEDGAGPTIFGSLLPFLDGSGPIAPAAPRKVADQIALLLGDLALSQYEDELSFQWPRCLDRDSRAFRVVTAFWRLIADASQQCDTDIVLVDVGPNLGAINRAALVAADHVVVPLAPDLFSVQGLRNLGPRLRRWREEWQERRDRNPHPDTLLLPAGSMRPIGYTVLGHGVRVGRPVQAYQRWLSRIPTVYRAAVLAEPAESVPAISADPHCLAQLKHYHSLLPLGQEARKPVFYLKPADGAFGGHQQAAQRAFFDFQALAERIVAAIERPPA